MRNQIICLFVVFLIQTGNCITEYGIGDTLYTWAASGLNVREAPNTRSKVIDKANFGEPVLCKGEKHWQEYLYGSVKIKDVQPIGDKETKTLTLKGNWVFVKYKDIEGYVFDAYLSKLQPPAKESNIYILESFKKEFGVVKHIGPQDSLSESGGNKVVLGNGAFLEEHYSESGGGITMTIPHFSIEEALLMIMYYDGYALDIIQKGENTIEIHQETGGYTISTHGNITIISGEWGC